LLDLSVGKLLRIDERKEKEINEREERKGERNRETIILVLT
jgi:hypothetical protein